MSENSGEGEKKPDGRWDEKNRPVGYILGVTPGYSQFGQGEERLINMGLARKVVKAARLGFDFTEIDYEALSEMYEPDVDRLLKHVKEVQKMEVGLHLPTKVDLCVANAFEWKEMHEILRKGAFSGKDIVGSKFILFHTSSRIRPHVTFTIGHQEPSVQQNSFDGTNLGQWIDSVDDGNFKDPKTGNAIKLSDGKSMRDWFKAMFIKVLYHMMGMAGDVGVLTFLEKYRSFSKGVEAAAKRMEDLQQEVWDKNAKQEMIGLLQDRISLLAKSGDPRMQGEINRLNSLIYQIQNTKLEKDLDLGDYERAKQRIIEKWLNDGVLPEESIGKLSKKYKEWTICYDVKRTVINIDFDKVLDFWVTKGSECEEQISYRVIAKYMYWTKDPIWTDLVGDYDPDIIIKCADLGKSKYDKNIFEGEITDISKKREENSDDEKKKATIDELVKRLITAVACKYIEGHLYIGGDIWGMKAEFPEIKELKDESVYSYCKNAKMMIFIETSMPPEGQEGELRIMSAHDTVALVKHLDKGEITAYTMDFEHLTVNFIKVQDDIKSLKEGDAKYIKMMHINAPRPIIGAHSPVYIMSHDMFILYDWLFMLREKGMKNAYFIWEMGSFGVDQSAVAFRKMVEELSKGTGPKDLPQEFYGIDDTLWAAQHHAIRNHGLDPLKGMIMVPEVDHGVLSKAAHEKGKAKEWEEGKYKY